MIQLFRKIAEEDSEKFEKVQETYGSIFKLGAVEDLKNRDQLTELTRFHTNQRNNTSLDQVCMVFPSDSNEGLILFSVSRKQKARPKAGMSGFIFYRLT